MALGFLPMLSTFVIVAIAEFGDKTQIAVVNLSCEHRPRSIFIGALLAFALVVGVSASIGGAIAPYISAFWIGLVGGVSFLIFGVCTLFSRKNRIVKIKEHSKTVTTSFLLIAIAELGDKTQLAIIALSAKFGAPVQVFLGAMLAFALLTALGVVLGKIISRYVSTRYVKIGASLIFILFGILFLFQAFSRTRLF
ncbi:MAG TPA: TMEM165/GDT1 family protein [Candidatus Acidoferrales bacterium]|nr:TMEM165/GDT1 family protein [Candidatus Acidoferrales bacterium]